MAKVVTSVHRIEFLLECLTRAWEGLPRVSQEIDNWDLIEQIDYVEEWSPKEAMLAELNRCAASGMLDETQRARYDNLQQLVAKHRPVLARLRG